MPFVFSFTTMPCGFMQKVRTLSSKSCVLYTILLSYSSSVRCENIRAGSSTRTPISTRFDLVGISRSLQTFSIHLLPLLPTEMIQYLLSYVLSAVFTAYPDTLSVRASSKLQASAHAVFSSYSTSTDSTGVSK